MNSNVTPEALNAHQTLQSSTWVYRSYRNDIGLVDGDPTKALALIFGEGVFTLTQDEQTISGEFVMSSDYILDVRGQLTDTESATKLAFVGKGRPGTPTEGWEYDYQAFLCPVWPTSVNQVPAFVGTVLRAVPHNGAPAGVTASFIMLADTSHTGGQ